VDDIFTCSEDITALSGGDLKKKMGILSSAPSSVFIVVYTFMAPGFVSAIKTILEKSRFNKQ